MSRLHEMTTFQKQFAEENHNIVFSFLNHKGLSVEEYYDIVIFGYLSAVQEYDENPALSRFQFGVIAWKKMGDCVLEHFRYENRLKRKAPMVDIDTYTIGGLTLDEILPDRRKDLSSQTADKLFAMEVFSCLKETERQMVYLRANGLRDRKIAEIFSVTESCIQKRFYFMRKRLKESMV